MTAEVVTVLALVAGILWLGIMIVSAFRNRGGEEIAANLRPGIDDQQLETRRLEKGQKAAIAFSAFLAVSLPLYYLGEPNRQEGFVEAFEEESIERGEHIVAEFGCFNCHGPLGAGGSATYVEQRSGVTVTWTAPALNDILYRYDVDEVNFWVTYGRGNTPMPGWGLAGNGPLNEAQVDDVVNYLASIQISQQDVANATGDKVSTALGNLDGADAAIAAAIVSQEQVIAEIDQAPTDSEVVEPLAKRARAVLIGAAEGIDTDDDGLSDNAEAELSAISQEAFDFFSEIDPTDMDPAVPDAEKAEAALAALGEAKERDPILVTYFDAVEGIVTTGGEGEDTDGDGISDDGESKINAQMATAATATTQGLTVISLDPRSPESVVGDADAKTATTFVGALETVAINKGVLVENEDRIRPNQEAGLDFLQDAQSDRLWVIDVAGVATSMESSEEEASRAVGLFNAYCARCHTASFSAGLPFAQEAGSGGFGPALWDGRSVVQFGELGDSEPDLLIDFLTKGSEAQKPYGLNGFGSGRMPGFGQVLSVEDIELLARYLRGGNMDGIE